MSSQRDRGSNTIRECDNGADRQGEDHTGIEIVRRVMRCFCGCSTLTHEQIEHIALMNVSTLVVHPNARKLFENFLRIGHRTDKSEAMALLECHELCDRFLQNLHLIHDSESIDDLLSLCPSFALEEKLLSSIQSADLPSVRRCLIDLKRECINNIECHNDYDRFHRELLRKIDK